MKKVFDNKMVQHVFAQQTQSEGRTSNGNHSFYDNVLYSYSTPIAAIYTHEGKRFVFITTNSYSLTTSCKHMPNSATFNYPAFYVPFIGVRGGQNYHDVDGYKNAILPNIDALKVNVDREITRARRARNFYPDRIRYVYSKLVQFCEFFNEEIPQYDIESIIKDIEQKAAEREAKNSTPEAIAKRAKDKERREALKAKKEAEAREAMRIKCEADINAWLAGETNYLSRYSLGSILLRVRGEEIETSQGAKFPVSHGIKAFNHIINCIKENKEFVTNGKTIHLGNFQIDKIETNGNVKAGCHYVEFAEIERIAKQLNLTQ